MNNKLTDEEITELVLKLFDGSSFYFQSGRRPGAKTMAELLNKAACAVAELQERRKADSAEPIYQYRIRNGYNGQVTEWQTIRRDQVDFVLKAQPLNAEFRIISTLQPASVVNEFIPKNLDRALGVVGVALPESKEEFNFQTERWIQRLIDRVIRYSDEFCEQPALASLDAVASYPEKLPCPVFLEPGLRFGKGVTTSLMLGALQRRAEYYAELDAMTPEQRAEHDAGIAEFKAMPGNTEVSVPTKEGA
ncbi:hypothetical protein [Citrobacter cronae]|uniref:hypothetical protein n=1 Tax=Citrobacter cronae TaxID=1748967 RepID=UPI0021D23467|nr:hypothetical protein [Citrobacter cronae]